MKKVVSGEPGRTIAFSRADAGPPDTTFFTSGSGLGQTTQAKQQLLRGEGAHRLELPRMIPPSRSAPRTGGQSAPGTGPDT